MDVLKYKTEKKWLLKYFPLFKVMKDAARCLGVLTSPPLAQTFSFWVCLSPNLCVSETCACVCVVVSSRCSFFYFPSLTRGHCCSPFTCWTSWLQQWRRWFKWVNLYATSRHALEPLLVSYGNDQFLYHLPSSGFRYLSGVVQDFGFNIVPLLVHHVHFWMQLFT